MPDRRSAVARRRRNLLLAALAAFVLGCVAGALLGRRRGRAAGPGAGSPPPASPPARARAPVDGLTLRQQVGQLVVLRFAGTTPPAYVRAALRGRRAAA